MKATFIRIVILIVIVVGIAACLCSCISAWKLNEQTRPHFDVPKSEHYPTGKTMEEYTEEVRAKGAREKTEFEKLK